MADFDSSLPIRTENPGDVIAKIADATVPSQQLAVNADGSVNITDNGGSITVDGAVTVSATDLDIRDLSAAQDNVAISDGTDVLEVNADGSINSVVTATDLDIRDLSSAQDSVEVLQATHDNLNANANIQVGDADVGNANPVPVSDAGGSLTVDATDLDIRDLTHVSDSVKVGDGVDFLAVNADGSINVVVSGDLAGTEIVDPQTSAAVAGGATATFDYTVTALKTFIGEQVWASGSGKIKVEVQRETAAASGTFVQNFVGFNSTSNPNVEIPLKRILKQVAGAKVRIIITNRDNQAQDVYSTLLGSEI